MRIRNNKVNVFLSDDEKFFLKRDSSKLNLSQSEYIRNLIIGYEIKIPEVKEEPKPKKEGLFAHGFGLKVILQGCLFGMLSLIAYAFGLYFTNTEIGGQTLAFMVLALSQIVQSYNMRSEHSLFKIGPFKNKTLNLAAISSVVLTALVMFVPFLNTMFELTLLPLWLYGVGVMTISIAVGLIFVPLVVMETSKLVGFLFSRKK